MTVKKKEFSFKSAAGRVKIHGISWKPADGEIKYVLQLVHGMAEYIDRYDEMARYMAERGIAVYGCDHIGHGKSVSRKCPLGYFGKKNKGGRIFIEDTKKLTDIAKKENPNVPFIIFGHSMGSFVARAYSAKYGNQLDAAIFCGTGDPGRAAVPALGLMSKPLKLGRGKREGKLMNKLSFGSFNDRTEGRTEFDWLSVNDKNVDRYVDDPLCGFCFSRRGFHDLATLLKHVTKKRTFKKIPKELPILLIAGEEDPVGGYGKDVRKVHMRLKLTGHRKTRIKLFEGCRHEIHNERNREEVYRHIYRFIEKNA